MTLDEALKILKKEVFSVVGSFNDNPKRYYEALKLVIEQVEKDRELIKNLFNTVDEMQKIIDEFNGE